MISLLYSSIAQKFIMATIKNFTTKVSIVLRTQHNFGRNKHCNTCMVQKDISKSHATIYWKGSNWYLKDHSKNGTLVNGELIVNTTLKLAKGNLIQFGQNKSTVWEIVDLEPPKSYLQSLYNQNKVMELSKSGGKSYDCMPEVVFYFTKDHKWKATEGNNTILLEHGKNYNFNNEEFVFVENELQDETIDYGYITSCAYFEFDLSDDEEYVNVKIVSNDLVLDLGGHVYNHLLLMLARKRQSDIHDGARLEPGWINIEELAYGLGKELFKQIDMYYLNLQIHRLRKKLIGLAPFGYLFSNVVERRNGKIRFAHPYFKILKNNQLQGRVMPSAKSIE